MRQAKIETPGDLLGPDGSLAQRGYSTQSVLRYNRDAIKAAPWRIKEWDFYQVSNREYCVQLTIGHVSYAGSVTVDVFEFATGKRTSVSSMLAFPFSRLNMPRSAERGDLTYRGKNIEMRFLVSEGKRTLICRAQSKNGPKIAVDIELSQPDPTSMVIATPFREHPSLFYYNHKINCMPASGTAIVGDTTYRFDPEDAFGLLDWGRGVWPFRHEWFWGSGSGYVDGKRFGFNIGHGFGNTEAATENMLFYDGEAHKIGKVFFTIADGGYMSEKRFTSDDGRFEMVFTPLYDRITKTKVLFVDNCCHQIFGKFNGKAVLDDGREIEVKDLVAFAEHAVNRW